MSYQFKNPKIRKPSPEMEIYKIIKALDKYEIIFRNINDIIVILDNELGILYFNSVILFENLNYQKDDLIGKNIFNIIHEDDVDKTRNFIEKIDGNKKSKIEIRLKHKNQKYYWFDLTGIKTKEEQTKIQYLIILKNINDIKNAEEKYKNLFESSPNAIVLLNFSGIIIDANLTTIKMFNKKKEDLIFQPIHTLPDLYPNEIKPFFKIFLRLHLKVISPNPSKLN